MVSVGLQVGFFGGFSCENGGEWMRRLFVEAFDGSLIDQVKQIDLRMNKKTIVSVHPLNEIYLGNESHLGYTNQMGNKQDREQNKIENKTR